MLYGVTCKTLDTQVFHLQKHCMLKRATKPRYSLQEERRHPKSAALDTGEWARQDYRRQDYRGRQSTNVQSAEWVDAENGIGNHERNRTSKRKNTGIESLQLHCCVSRFDRNDRISEWEKGLRKPEPSTERLKI